MEVMPSRLKDDESNSPSGSDADGTSGADEEGDRPSKKNKRYHRHTPYQIAEMEQLFKECPHPDEKQRLELSQSLGLEPRQVKFWFQNRRTQMKAHTERAENSLLRAENDRVRLENQTLRDALKNATCPKCGTSVIQGIGPDVPPEVARIMEENKRLKAEIERVSSLASRHLAGISSSEPGTPTLTKIKADYGAVNQSMSNDIVPAGVDGGFSLTAGGGLSEREKELVYDLAMGAMDELCQLARDDCPFWIPSSRGSNMEILNLEEYRRRFPNKLGHSPAGLVQEATRATGLVVMSASALVEIIIDPARWSEMFPSLISRAVTVDLVSTGNGPGKRSGALQLMYAETQVLSPLVPTRESFFLRFCKQLSEGKWAVADISVDSLRADPPAVMLKCRRRPSGYIIEDMPNSCSQVTVVEHLEVDTSGVHHLFRHLVGSGAAFGALRWLSALQRQSDRLASSLSPHSHPGDPSSPTPTVSIQGRRSLLRLAQRMTSHFCTGVSASTQHTWTVLSGSDVEDVRIMTRKSVNNPGEPNGVILSSATTVWLPVPPERLFSFLKDDRARGEWDILANGGTVTEMGRVVTGMNESNSVTLLKVEAPNAGQGNMLILQENVSDSTGAMVIYAPVDIPAMQQVITGGDSEGVALLPSGFVVVPDMASPHERRAFAGPMMTSPLGLPDSGDSSGSLLTVAFQILVSPLAHAKLSVESIATVNSLISCTVQKIRLALHCT